MRPSAETLSILRRFARHEREYWVFTLGNGPEEFLYFSHRTCDLRSLLYGSGFFEEILRIEEEKPHLCIECGLGTRIRGGVSLDGGEIVVWNCSVPSANEILKDLREKCGNDERRMKGF